MFQVHNCGFFQWHDGPVNERSREVMKQLRNENNLLYAENKKLKKSMAYYDVDSEIAELWVQFKRMKKSRIQECEKCKRKMVIAYSIVVLSWRLFLFMLI